MTKINWFLAVMVVIFITLTGVVLSVKKIGPLSLIDYIHEIASRTEGNAGKAMEDAVTVACTTLVRTEVSPLITRRALVGMTESIVQIRCSDFHHQYSDTRRRDIEKGLIFDWVHPDGYMEMYMWMELSIPVTVDVSSMTITTPYSEQGNLIVFTLPLPVLGDPRVNYATLVQQTESGHLNNSEIAYISVELFRELHDAGCRSATRAAEESAVIQIARDNLSSDIISMTAQIYPEATVQVNFTEHRQPSIRH